MASSILNLTGKVALVTGASSGIGASCAVLFSKLGASLVITGRNEASLKSVKDECVKHSPGQEHLALLGDLSKEDDSENVVKSAVEKFNRLDILVNNAGIMELGSLENTTLEKYDKVMNINARSVFHIMKLCVPYLLKTKGNVVNVSSICGTRSFPDVLAYCLSKTVVDQLTDCASLELASRGVRVNCVNPGVILTDLQRKSGLSDEQYLQFLEKSKLTHPIGRPGYPEEVANTIAFLASDMASDITGEHIHVDGGRHNVCPR